MPHAFVTYFTIAYSNASQPRRRYGKRSYLTKCLNPNKLFKGIDFNPSDCIFMVPPAVGNWSVEDNGGYQSEMQKEYLRGLYM